MFEVRVEWMLWAGHKIDIGNDTELLLSTLNPPRKLGNRTCHCKLCDFRCADVGCG